MCNDVSCSVLLIDDESLTEELLRHGLDGASDIALRFLRDGNAAVEHAIACQASVVIADLRMPGADGFHVIRLLRAHPATEHLPVILLSSEDSAETKVQAFAGGANDYLVKWPDPRELAARIRYHSAAYRARCERDSAYLSLRRSQAELAASQAALHQAKKMEAIGQLTGGVAHDFNNVLQIIGGNLQLLKMGGNWSDKSLARLEQAQAGVERGARLASHLLAFARRQPLQAVVVDPARLLREVSEVLGRVLGERIALRLELGAGLSNIAIDPNQFSNVLLNLAINARDAMPAGGALTVRAANVEAMPGLPGAGGVLVEVADDGHGMPAHVLERAFDPFFTTKPTGEGTGLGLSMAYGFIKQSGGEIVLDSEPGRGTTVRIYLPRCDGAASPDRPVLPAVPQEGGAETILVVEDETDVRTTTVDLLLALGYRVLQAEDARGAIEIVQSGAAIDLVFTDVIMPGQLTSFDLSETVRARLPGTPVLFTSGYAEGVLAHEGKLDPSVNLLSKPYQADALASRIRQLLRQRAAPAAA